MLITISGMVGSGKSTTARLVVELLAGAGLKARYLRFRYLKLFGFDRKRSRSPTDPRANATAATSARGTGFSPRRLTAALTVGYIARILAFRLSGVGTLRDATYWIGTSMTTSCSPHFPLGESASTPVCFGG